MDEINYSFKPTGQLSVSNFKPNYNISFHNNSEGGTGKEVGKLDFNGPKMVFTGDAEESAKVFIDWVARSFHGRLEEERKAEREACAKVCDDLPTPERMSLDNESLWEAATLDCADAIRARGNT
jgi:hypothetical protein